MFCLLLCYASFLSTCHHHIICQSPLPIKVKLETVLQNSHRIPDFQLYWWSSLSPLAFRWDFGCCCSARDQTWSRPPGPIDPWTQWSELVPVLLSCVPQFAHVRPWPVDISSSTSSAKQLSIFLWRKKKSPILTGKLPGQALASPTTWAIALAQSW